MRRGAYSASEFRQKMSANAPVDDLWNIFNHDGINTNSIGGAKGGTAMRDGRVIVDGKIVATSAHLIGRQNIGNSKRISIKGKNY